jgi:anti-anti-sigma factor
MTIQIVKLECARLNSAAGPEVAQKLSAAWASGATAVAVDFSDVVYIDSLGISALMAAYRKRPQGTRVVLCALNDYVREVLEITQLVRVFDVYVSADAVLRAAS